MKKDAERIHANHAEPACAGRDLLINRGSHGSQGTSERYPSQGTAIVAGGQQRIYHHQDGTEDAEDDLRKNLDVIELLVHRLAESLCNWVLCSADL